MSNKRKFNRRTKIKNVWFIYFCRELVYHFSLSCNTTRMKGGSTEQHPTQQKENDHIRGEKKEGAIVTRSVKKEETIQKSERER
jgi:hypothetical protein